MSSRETLFHSIVKWMREADKAPRRRHLFANDLAQSVYDVVLLPVMVLLPSRWVSALGLTTIRDYRIEAVKKHLTGFVLDIGAGWDNRLIEEYGHGVGIDIQYWEGYEGFHSDRLLVCRSEQTCFRNSQFDTVSIVAALNHIPNREEVLLEVRRLLKDDGSLIMTMVSPWISWINHNLRFLYDPDRDRDWDEKEVWGLTKPQMMRLIDMTGFQLERRTLYFFGLSSMYICKKK